MSYTYQNDESSVGALNFGLNTDVKMVKFEFNPNGGAGGAEQDCLDIVFEINGKEVSYRKFPVTRAIDKATKNEVTNPAHPAMQEAFNEFNAVITHVMICFVPREQYIKALAKPVSSFKSFCELLMNILPANYKDVTLDLFAHYQWAIKGDATRTFLEIPKNVKHGKFLCPKAIPVGGAWKKIEVSEPSDSTRNALCYKDEDGNLHPFIRNGWYMKSNFAKGQKDFNAIDDSPVDMSSSHNTMSESSDEGGTW